MRKKKISTSQLNEFLNDIDVSSTRDFPQFSDSVAVRVISCSEYEITREVRYQGRRCIQKIMNANYELGTVYEYLFKSQTKDISCACVPQVYFCQCQNGYREVILEYIEGCTLDVAFKKKAFSLAEKEVLFVHLCRAVQAFSSIGDRPFVHRDIKPDNIILEGNLDDTASIRVRLLDLSMAREFDAALPYDSHCFGTRSYAPPEQFGYKQTDIRADVYALGRVLYFLCTGEEPSGETTFKQCKDKGIPFEMAELIGKATRFDPQQRFQSVTDLTHAFYLAMARIPLGTVLDEEISGTWSYQKHRSKAPLTRLILQRYSLSKTTRRVLSWIGIGWDCALLFLAIVLILASIEGFHSMAFSTHSITLHVYITAMLIKVYMIALPIIYLISYKEPLYIMLGRTQPWPILKTAIVYVVCLTISVILAWFMPYFLLA